MCLHVGFFWYRCLVNIRLARVGAHIKVTLDLDYHMFGRGNQQVRLQEAWSRIQAFCKQRKLYPSMDHLGGSLCVCGRCRSTLLVVYCGRGGLLRKSVPTVLESPCYVRSHLRKEQLKGDTRLFGKSRCFVLLRQKQFEIAELAFNGLQGC
jgi:hypothetical protein